MDIGLERPTCGLSACGEMLIVYCGKAALTKAASTTVNETVEKGILEDCVNPASTPKDPKRMTQSISDCQEPSLIYRGPGLERRPLPTQVHR